MKNEKTGFRNDPVRTAAVAVVLAFACCILAQILGCAGSLNDLFVVVMLEFFSV